MSDLDTVIKRMIAAGEPEENIALVIRASKPSATPETSQQTQQPKPKGRDFKIFGVNIHVPSEEKPRLDSNVATIGGFGIAPEDVLMAPALAKSAIAAIPATGRAVSATGRGIELVAKSRPAQRISELGAVGEALYRGDIAGGLIAAAAPRIAAVTGRGMQRVGGAMQRFGAPAVEKAVERIAPAVVEKAAERLAPAAVEAVAKPSAAAIRPVAPPADSAVSQSAVAGRLKLLAEQKAAESFNPSAAMQSARAAFASAGVEPMKAEVSNVMELIRRGKAPDDALQIIVKARPAVATVAPATAQVVAPAATSAAAPAAAKLNLTAEEVQAGFDLMKRGKTQKEAFDAVMAQRALKKVPGVQSSAEARAVLDQRHASGQIKTPSAQTAAARRAAYQPPSEAPAAVASSVVPEAASAAPTAAAALDPFSTAALRWIKADMENFPYVSRTVTEAAGHSERHGQTLIAPSSPGARIYEAIVGAAGPSGKRFSSASRADVMGAIDKIIAGKPIKPGSLMDHVRGVADELATGKHQSLMETPFQMEYAEGLIP